MDPGIGFAKHAEHNIELLRPANLANLIKLLGDRPMMVGASRKRFLQKIAMESRTNRGVDMTGSVGTFDGEKRKYCQNSVCK